MSEVPDYPPPFEPESVGPIKQRVGKIYEMDADMAAAFHISNTEEELGELIGAAYRLNIGQSEIVDLGPKGRFEVKREINHAGGGYETQFVVTKLS